MQQNIVTITAMNESIYKHSILSNKKMWIMFTGHECLVEWYINLVFTIAERKELNV